MNGLTYCINQELSLKVFLNNRKVPLDNNAAESALRSFCLHNHTLKLIDSIGMLLLHHYRNGKSKQPASLPLSEIHTDEVERTSR
ncbi:MULTISPECIES: IS66 family transposase [Blautia]|uniref:IS66 family transposase n=1 Tax=Blautia TaxID=572511 RepID=UPI00164E31D6|nr:MULTISPECIES: transposase [Blautia]